MDCAAAQPRIFWRAGPGAVQRRATGVYRQRGTGFDHDAQKKIYDQLKKLRQTESALSEVPRLKEAIEWVEPRLVARVKYGNWTDGNRLRAPVFLVAAR